MISSVQVRTVLTTTITDGLKQQNTILLILLVKALMYAIFNGKLFLTALTSLILTVQHTQNIFNTAFSI